MTAIQAGTRPTILGARLHPIVRALRRALWRHVGRFVTASPPRYGRGRQHEPTAGPTSEHRPLLLN